MNLETIQIGIFAFIVISIITLFVLCEIKDRMENRAFAKAEAEEFAKNPLYRGKC